MLGEYVAIVTMCAMTSILFLGGWLPPLDIAPLNWIPGPIWFLIKITFVFFMFAMVKAMVPRYRYDQLMRLGWKIFLPLSLVMVVLVAGFLQYGPMASAGTTASSATAPVADATNVRSVDTFDSVCLGSLPKFPSVEAFAAAGYSEASQDADVKGSKQGGFAGLGRVGIGDTDKRLNGCLVYVPGLDGDGLTRAVVERLQRRFAKLIPLSKNGNDSYWGIGDFAPANGFIVFVSPKPDGKFAGHTLLMVSTPAGR